MYQPGSGNQHTYHHVDAKPANSSSNSCIKHIPASQVKQHAITNPQPAKGVAIPEESLYVSSEPLKFPSTILHEQQRDPTTVTPSVSEQLRRPWLPSAGDKPPLNSHVDISLVDPATALAKMQYGRDIKQKQHSSGGSASQPTSQYGSPFPKSVATVSSSTSSSSSPSHNNNNHLHHNNSNSSQQSFASCKKIWQPPVAGMVDNLARSSVTNDSKVSAKKYQETPDQNFNDMMKVIYQRQAEMREKKNQKSEIFQVNSLIYSPGEQQQTAAASPPTNSQQPTTAPRTYNPKKRYTGIELSALPLAQQPNVYVDKQKPSVKHITVVNKFEDDLANGNGDYQFAKRMSNILQQQQKYHVPPPQLGPLMPDGGRARILTQNESQQLHRFSGGIKEQPEAVATTPTSSSMNNGNHVKITQIPQTTKHLSDMKAPVYDSTEYEPEVTDLSMKKKKRDVVTSSAKRKCDNVPVNVDVKKQRVTTQTPASSHYTPASSAVINVDHHAKAGPKVKDVVENEVLKNFKPGFPRDIRWQDPNFTNVPARDKIRVALERPHGIVLITEDTAPPFSNHNHNSSSSNSNGGVSSSSSVRVVNGSTRKVAPNQPISSNMINEDEPDQSAVLSSNNYLDLPSKDIAVKNLEYQKFPTAPSTAMKIKNKWIIRTQNNKRQAIRDSEGSTLPLEIPESYGRRLKDTKNPARYEKKSEKVEETREEKERANLMLPVSWSRQPKPSGSANEGALTNILKKNPEQERIENFYNPNDHYEKKKKVKRIVPPPKDPEALSYKHIHGNCTLESLRKSPKSTDVDEFSEEEDKKGSEVCDKSSKNKEAKSDVLPASVLKNKKKVKELQLSGEAFLQDTTCALLAFKTTKSGRNVPVPKCVECVSQPKNNAEENFCRFYYFRK